MTNSSTKFGLGTYRGSCDDYADASLDATISEALARGIRHFDTAINYRCQRAERVLGHALRRAFAAGATQRRECRVSSKAGFVPWDGVPPSNEAAHDWRTVIDAGLAVPEQLTSEGHCIAPTYLAWSFRQSLENLGLDYLDCLYIHNPEAQLAIASHETVYARLQAAFELLETFVTSGRLGAYGISTWAGLRVPCDHPEHLSLQRIVDAASAVTKQNHFRYVQAPLNLLMPEAATAQTQECYGIEGQRASLLSVAARLGISVVVSAPLHGGALRQRATAALDFVRSLPNIDCVLVGARRPSDVELPARLFSMPR